MFFSVLAKNDVRKENFPSLSTAISLNIDIICIKIVSLNSSKLLVPFTFNCFLGIETCFTETLEDSLNIYADDMCTYEYRSCQMHS